MEKVPYKCYFNSSSHMNRLLKLNFLFLWAGTVLCCLSANGQTLDITGVTLLQELNTNLNGAGVRVAQIEAGDDADNDQQFQQRKAWPSQSHPVCPPAWVAHVPPHPTELSKNPTPVAFSRQRSKM